ncbi:RNA polymerase sigma factor [Paenibacillus daejeonensis]|uniref:RNA polymerase sigma factor n=1 Tax=Paenibacillus daejeonensis TaxID=135193 RepID=UPI00037A08CB|nr:sigma-70 family RNA polymerase sigma factor [Paenibacillus daejeonensis]
MEKQWFDLLHRPYDELEKDQQESIYKKHRTIVYQDLYALLADHALTEDLIHESFLKVILKAPHLQSIKNIPAWMKRVAYTTAIDFIRKTNREKEQLAAIGPLYEKFEKNVVESVLEEKWRLEGLHEALKELGTTNRQVLNLFYVEDKSCKEIGEIVNITETATYKRLSRAREHLRKLITKT